MKVFKAIYDALIGKLTSFRRVIVATLYISSELCLKNSDFNQCNYYIKKLDLDSRLAKSGLCGTSSLQFLVN